MAQTKPKVMLIEHGRYACPRKIPLKFQSTAGRKSWRAPLGADIDAASARGAAVRRVAQEARAPVQPTLTGVLMNNVTGRSLAIFSD